MIRRINNISKTGSDTMTHSCNPEELVMTVSKIDPVGTEALTESVRTTTPILTL